MSRFRTDHTATLQQESYAIFPFENPQTAIMVTRTYGRYTDGWDQWRVNFPALGVISLEEARLFFQAGLELVDQIQQASVTIHGGHAPQARSG
jgi:hypothetical protein